MLCTDGTLPYIDQQLRTVRICNPFLRYTFPPEFTCHSNERISIYQCCQTPTTSTYTVQKHNTIPAPSMSNARLACPHAMRPFMHPRTHQPIVCQPGAAGFCPYSSMCQYSALYWQFICCQAD